jgi:hypothetical protein
MAKKIYVRNNDNTEWVPLATSIPNASAYATYEYVDNELENIDLISTINTASAAAVTYLVDSAPETLNTLNELSAALNDDANFASTVAASLGNKLDISTASATYLTQSSASTTYANMTTTPISGFRNAIINGDFQINQRAFTSTTGSVYGFDRWISLNNDGTTTYSAQTFTPGNAITGYEPTNFARLVTSGQTTSGAYSILQQRIEDVRTFAGQTITISFWAKAGSGTPTVAIEMEQVFGSGGSPSAPVQATATKVTLSTSWVRYTATVTIPSISGKTIGTSANTSYIQLNLWVSSGSVYTPRTTMGIQSNTFDFWGVQVERGAVATPFEQRPIGMEMILAQRYFEFSNGLTQVIGGGNTGFGGNTYFSWTPYTVEKRVALTVVTNNTAVGVRLYNVNSTADTITMWKAGTAYDSNIESFEVTTTRGFGLTTSGGQTDASLGRFFWYANAEL